MSEHIPEQYREDIETLIAHAARCGPDDVVAAANRIDACLPEPEPTFTDEEALAFGQAVWGDEYTAREG